MKKNNTLTRPSSSCLTLVIGDLADAGSMIAEKGELLFGQARQEFFARVEECLQQQQGHLVKRIEDGFVSVFQNPADAVSFARLLLHSLRRQTVQVGDTPLKARLVIHTGKVQVKVTSYGEDVFGVAVQEAARLLGHAGEDQAIITAETARLLPEGIRTSLGPSQRKTISRIPGEVEISTLDGSEG